MRHFFLGRSFGLPKNFDIPMFWLEYLVYWHCVVHMYLQLYAGLQTFIKFSAFALSPLVGMNSIRGLQK